MQKYEDQEVSKSMSALVLIGAVMFTSSVYMAYSQEQDIVLYTEIESAYNNSANVFLGLREAVDKVNVSIPVTDDEKVLEEKIELE